MGGQKKEMEPPNQVLNQLHTNNSSREREPPICSSEEELNRLLIGDGFSGNNNEIQVIAAKIKQLIDERSEIDQVIEKLQDELETASDKRDKAREAAHDLWKMHDDANAFVIQNRSILNKAIDFACKKDVAAIKELSNSELEKFMKTWNESKIFWEDYEKRLLQSLDNRQLSRDGRIKFAYHYSF